jgi:hypothetical protein
MHNTFQGWCCKQHDVICNQQYGNKHPYSFHLDMVASIASYHMKNGGYLVTQTSGTITPNTEYENILDACYGHDMIEDARITYNDILSMSNRKVADIIYACTEEKGKNRSERHNNKYFEELLKNKSAVFVKCCDIAANSLYSLTTNSSMYNKYSEEWPKFKTQILELYPDLKNVCEYNDRIFMIRYK